MILDQALMLLPLLVGGYITLSLLKLPDFSLESAYLFGAVSAFMAKDLPLPLVVLSAMGGGAVVGAVVSTLNQFCRLPFLLSAIITNGFFHGLTQYFLGTSLKSFHMAVSEETLFVTICALLVTTMFFLFRSQLGFSLAIYGNNPLFFEHHTVSGKYVTIAGVMIGHAAAGLGGFIFALSNGFVDLTMSYGMILVCLTALILGKSVIRTPRPNLLVPLLSLLLFLALQQTLLHVGLNLKYFNAFQALFVLSTLIVLHRKKKISLDHLGV
jgi:ABC-type uncharacterized transport system permease subunit